MNNNNVLKKLSIVSYMPGVYLMKNSNGKVIYVGKAGNLKKRLSSYFNNFEKLDQKTKLLVQKIEDFETIITKTENEALILESNLIKQYRPRYNVILKDDKRYPSLCLDVSSKYPNLLVVRKIKKDSALYFGPFSSSVALRETLKLINKTFKLRKCKHKDIKKRLRPCLNYQMGRCLGPCCIEVDKKEYKDMVDDIILFLKGKASYLIQKTKEDMITEAKSQEFEKAAALRDRMFSLEKIVEKQSVVANDFKDRDVIGIARNSEFAIITILFIRNGIVLGTKNFTLDDTISSDMEIIEAFIKQYYAKSPFTPREILTPVDLEDRLILENWLKEEKNESISIINPLRGEKLKLMDMAFQNAQNSLKEKTALAKENQNVLSKLQKSLKLSKMPKRIECFDNSNLLGKDAVSCMVVFENGKPDKSSYRKYKIKTVIEQDDYAYMSEVLKRRYGKEELSKPYPDLLILDGGKGQLNISVSIIKELQLEGFFDIISIAKKDKNKGEDEDKIYKYGRANPINFGKDKQPLLFIQKIRDESHRFVIAYHRELKSKSLINSVFNDIKGIGKKRKKALLDHFKSIKNIKEASIEEICKAAKINSETAESLKGSLEAMGGII